jgi:pseudouridine-5'-phosphate glycosidase
VTADDYPAFFSRSQRLEGALAVQGAEGITRFERTRRAAITDSI